jgi:hypothetical protein
MHAHTHIHKYIQQQHKNNNSHKMQSCKLWSSMSRTGKVEMNMKMGADLLRVGKGVNNLLDRYGDTEP